MKRTILALCATIAAASVPLTGCAGLKGPLPDRVQLVAVKAEYLGTLAYVGFASNVVYAFDHNMVSADVKQKLKDIDARAYDILNKVHQGRATVDALLSILQEAAPLLPAQLRNFGYEDHTRPSYQTAGSLHYAIARHSSIG